MTEEEKIQDLKEEYKLIQPSISKWDRYSLYIKNWAITTWAIVLVFFLTQDSLLQAKYSILVYYIFYLILILLPVPFWVFDTLFKILQRYSVGRCEAIQDYLNNELNGINKDNFPIYDLTSRISKRKMTLYKSNYLKGVKFWRSFYVRIVSTIYLLLNIILSIIFTIIVFITFHFLEPVIIIVGVFFVGLLIVSWILSSKEII